MSESQCDHQQVQTGHRCPFCLEMVHQLIPGVGRHLTPSECEGLGASAARNLREAIKNNPDIFKEVPSLKPKRKSRPKEAGYYWFYDVYQKWILTYVYIPTFTTGVRLHFVNMSGENKSVPVDETAPSQWSERIKEPNE